MICQEKDCQEIDNLVKCRLTIYKGDWGISPIQIFMQYGSIAMWEYITKGWVDTYEYYCARHCQKNGYCYGCGEFWAGSESFDFGNGLCSNCKYDNDFYDDDDEEDNYYSEEYYADDDYPEDYKDDNSSG